MKPFTSCCAAYLMAWCSGSYVCTRTRPGVSPRPARPATWTRSWNARSLARKSGMESAASALMTPTSVTCGRSWPFVTICVPTRMSTSRARTRSRTFSICLPVATSRSSRAMRAVGERGGERLLELLGAEPLERDAVGVALRAARRAAAPRSRTSGTASCRPCCLWNVSATEQCGHDASSPHPSHRMLGAKPRRFRKRIVCSFAASVSSIARWSEQADALVAGRARADARADRRSRRCGISCARARSGSTSFVALPERASCSLSSDGVALPSTQTPPACARGGSPCRARGSARPPPA